MLSETGQDFKKTKTETKAKLASGHQLMNCRNLEEIPYSNTVLPCWRLLRGIILL